MLVSEKTVMIIVDVQGNLAHLMYNKDSLFKNLRKIIKGIQTLKIPILWVEQNPAGLGTTIPEIADLLPDIKPIKKMSFSSCKNPEFMKALKAANRDQILIVGIE
jgi:hypothetical protein